MIVRLSQYFGGRSFSGQSIASISSTVPSGCSQRVPSTAVSAIYLCVPSTASAGPSLKYPPRSVSSKAPKTGGES